MSTISKLAAAVWVLATLLIVVFPQLGIDPQFRLYYSNALQTLSSLISAFLCFSAMSAFPDQSPLRKVWGAIGVGVLAWGIGATIFAAYPLLNGGADTPYPYYSDIGYLLTGPFIIAGLLIFKRYASKNNYVRYRTDPESPVEHRGCTNIKFLIPTVQCCGSCVMLFA